MPSDFLSIGLSTLFYAMINFTWYSKWLFGSKATYRLKEILRTIVLGLIISYFLAFFEESFQSTVVSDGMLVALCAWLGFVFTQEIRQTKTFSQLLIDSGASLLSFLVMGGILGS